MHIYFTYNKIHCLFLWTYDPERASRQLNGKEYARQCRGCKAFRFNPWVGKIPWKRKWQPMPVFLPGESHVQRSLAGYSPQSCKESDTTKRLSLLLQKTFQECEKQWALTHDSYVLSLPPPRFPFQPKGRAWARRREGKVEGQWEKTVRDPKAQKWGLFHQNHTSPSSSPFYQVVLAHFFPISRHP